MHTLTSIHRVEELLAGSPITLPALPGVYAFWWIAPREMLLAANRQVVLLGPGKTPVNVEYRDWWPQELAYPCLYVGKTTNVRARFSQHILRSKEGRLHEAHPENWKAKPHNTSCQLRFGIEHVFPTAMDPLAIIRNSVGFSFRTDFKENAVAERFFEEDRLVGTWRPWFNIDSER